MKLNVGFHHMHKRKRIHEKHEKYPHPDKYKRILDKIMYPISLIGPVMLIPQILKIYINQNASSISVTSWAMFLVVSIFWILYGFIHKEKVILISNLAWIGGYIFVIFGALIYQN